MKRIVTISIEIDMDNPHCKEWSKPSEYFESEVDEVLDKVSGIGYRGFSKYASEEGKTKAGNQYRLVQKKVKPHATYSQL